MENLFSKYILSPFLNNIVRFSAKNAFCINEKFYTYNHLVENISKVRIALGTKTINSPLFGLVVNDDIETYASIFALWLEGFAYVPLHPKQPIERNIEIIDQADIELILDSSKYTRFKEFKIIKTSSLKPEKINIQPKSVPDTSLAYMLFTSGSTGKPKGVQISRKNIGAFMKSFWKTGISINETDRCLQCFDLTFDVSIQSYLVPLTTGACTYTVPHDEIKYSYVFGLLDDHKLTFGAMAPSMVRYLRPYFDEINISSMRYSILTAEASPVKLIKDWAKCIPNAKIFNFYGPTEATIYCSYENFNTKEDNKHLNGMLSIGKIMSGFNSIIIDENSNILEPGIKGELCVSGNQITNGYWGDSEKNKDSFFIKEIDGIAQKFYKTGDLCYLDKDGDIMLIGRIDYQVKIQGYRIELGEIEYHSREILEGINSVAVVSENTIGNSEITLFIEDELNKSEKVTKYLKEKLPSYMLPTNIISIKPFPINSSGKVDRTKLKKYKSE